MKIDKTTLIILFAGPILGLIVYPEGSAVYFGQLSALLAVSIYSLLTKE